MKWIGIVLFIFYKSILNSQNPIPCNELIRLRIFLQTPKDCGDIFKPIINDYGKCYTFNLLHKCLLFNNDDATYEVNPSDSTFATTEKPFTSAEPYTRN